MPDQSTLALDRHGPCLLRAARAALGWGLVEAGERTGVSIARVFAAERGGKATSPGTLNDLRRAYEAAGVRFCGNDAGGYGIQLLPR